MCFNQETTGFLSLFGLGMTFWVWKVSVNYRLAIGVFFFFLMEFLQFLQYFFINECDADTAKPGTFLGFERWQWNQWLTIIGYIHVCCQPFFATWINRALTKSPRYIAQYDVLLRLCVIGGFLLFLRWPLSYLPGYVSTPITSSYSTDFATNMEVPANAYPTTEWLRGEKICTYSGFYHLSWAIPMADVSYTIPSAAIHSFLMFSSYCVVKRTIIVQGVFLALTGPILAAWVSPNLQEQASIWCFFSLGQIAIMLFLIRDQLLVHWGRKTRTEEEEAEHQAKHNLAKVD